MANRHTKGSVISAVIRETKPRGGPPTSPRGGPGPERQTTARAGKSADTPKASWAARGDAAKLLRKAARQGSQRCGTLACRASQRCHSEVSARERGK